MNGPRMNFEHITQLLHPAVEMLTRDGYAVRTMLRDDQVLAMSVTSPTFLSLVLCTRARDVPDRAVVQVAGGGGHGAAPTEHLYRELFDSSWELEWGGPFARTLDDGTVTYGYRLAVPSDLAASGGASGLVGFVLGMVEYLGFSARVRALALGEARGRVLADQEQDDVRVMCALVGILG